MNNNNPSTSSSSWRQKYQIDPALRVIAELNVELLKDIDSLSLLSRAVLTGVSSASFEKERPNFVDSKNDEFNRNSLRWAVEMQDLDWAEVLLQTYHRGDSIPYIFAKDTTTTQWTPLHACCAKGDLDMLKILVSAIQKLNKPGEAMLAGLRNAFRMQDSQKQETPFLLLCRHLHYECIDYMLSVLSGCFPDEEIAPLLLIKNSEDQTCLHLIFSHSTGGLDAFGGVFYKVIKLAPTLVECYDSRGKNLLHLTAELGVSEICKFLVETCKMDVNGLTKSESKATPLHLACAKSMIGSHGVKAGGIIPTLLSLKANKNLKNGEGQTPEDVIKRLVDSHSFSQAQLTAMTVAMRRLEMHEKEV